MTRDDMIHDDSTPRDALPHALRFRLRESRRDALPARDLWPELSARLGERAVSHPAQCGRGFSPDALPVEAETPPTRAFIWLATAASVALAIGIGWQLRPASVSSPSNAVALAPGPMLVRQADAMAREYDAALRELQAAAPTLPDTRALRLLDRSAVDVRAALARDPDAVFLLEQLQRVYAQRLSLTRRLV